MRTGVKKIIQITLTIIITIEVISCSNTIENHEHEYSKNYSNDATYHWYSAVCEHSEQIKGKEEHLFSEWNIVRQPTEESEGLNQRFCSVCQYIETKTLKKLDHIHSKGTYHAAVAGNCVDKEIKEYWDCSNSTCNIKLDLEGIPLTSIRGTTNSAVHKAITTTWIKTLTTHKEIYDCCKASKTVEAVHSWNSGIITKQPTTTENGIKLFTCSICEHTKTEIIEKIVIVPEGFVKVTGTTISGSENWVPSSRVFISGRQLTIPTLLVCDHEVTVNEYKSLIGHNPRSVSIYKDGHELTEDELMNYPVECVNWYDALVYCNKLSAKENLTPCYSINGSTNTNLWGKTPNSSNDKWDAAKCNFNANGYRLPTEAEWEWLARGGKTYTYSGSNNIENVAWYYSSATDLSPKEVKTKNSNGYGIYDMSGNVEEWCWDWNGSITRTTAADGVDSGEGRMIRGGSYIRQSNFCKISDRQIFSLPYYRYTGVGFRIVRTVN